MTDADNYSWFIGPIWFFLLVRFIIPCNLVSLRTQGQHVAKIWFKVAALASAVSLAACAAPMEMRLVAVDGPELTMKTLEHHSDVVEIARHDEMVVCFDDCQDGRRGIHTPAIWIFFAEEEKTQIVFSDDENALLAEFEQEIDVFAKARVFSKNFNFDSSVLVGDLGPLKKLLALAKENPDLPVIVQGHTDAIGSVQYNKQLSFRRARAVGGWLVKNGIDPKRLQYENYGEARPIARNDTRSGREKNRRADVVIRAVISPAPTNEKQVKE